MTAAVVALVGWFIWARFPKVSSTIKAAVAELGGATPQWIADQARASQSPAPAPASSADSGVPRVPIADLALGPICRDFPAICGIVPGTYIDRSQPIIYQLGGQSR